MSLSRPTAWRFTFEGLTLELDGEDGQGHALLVSLLEDLGWSRDPTPGTGGSPLRWVVRSTSRPIPLPCEARELFRAEGLTCVARGDDVLLGDGSSLIRIVPRERQVVCRLHASFIEWTPEKQRSIFAFVMAKLLRPIGLYLLHGAGLVDAEGRGMLAVGASGSGKSTLTVELAKRGWRVLSDDTLLVTPSGRSVEAIAFRRYVSVATQARPESASGRPAKARRRIPVQGKGWLASRFVNRCVPQVLVLLERDDEGPTALTPAGASEALVALLAQSGPQLFDRSTMQGQLDTLRTLAERARAWRLVAGPDLYTEPGLLERCVSRIADSDSWLAC